MIRFWAPQLPWEGIPNGTSLLIDDSSMDYIATEPRNLAR